MCVIVDNDVCHEIIGPRSTPVGIHLRKWITNKGSKLVVGGQVLRELAENSDFRRWLAEALASGIAMRFSDQSVDELALELKADCESNDSHIIALARVSGARLLFTRDNSLKRDFKNRKLLGGSVRGRVYTSNKLRPGLRDSHKRLLQNTNLCESQI